VHFLPNTGRSSVVDETSALTLRMLEDFDTVAVVGLSADPIKAAHSVPAAMQAYGWRVIPVNPRADELLGETVYRRLADIPEPVEFVNVFRPAAEAPDVVRQAAEIGAKAVWLQLGIVSPEARAVAAEHGILYVEDRCIAVERARHALRRAG
jgi:predicted CoA-binding protein